MTELKKTLDDKNWRSAHYPFMTDEEFKSVFGEEIVRLVTFLDEASAKDCQECGGACCQRIKCGMFSSKFEKCPIYHYRPPKCRLYYCGKILIETEVNRIAERLTQLLEERFSLAIFLDPPVRIMNYDWLVDLGIGKNVFSIVNDLENELLSCNEAQKLLDDLIPIAVQSMK